MSFLAGIELSVVAMLIVFALLYVIALILGTFKTLFKSEQNNTKEKVKKNVKEQVPVTPAVEESKKISFEELEKDNDMLVAAMVASMEMAKETKNNFRIVRIKQL